MTVSELFLGAIAALLLMIYFKVHDLASRFKERFPTAKEQDDAWATNDPAGHWEAHKNDKK